MPVRDNDLRSFRSYAVIPAAGRSSRMGQAKMLLPWAGTTLIQHVLRIWKSSRVTHVAAVIRSEDSTLRELCEAEGVEIVLADAPPEMKDSVAIGLLAVEMLHTPCDRDVWLMAPADMPGLSAGCINRLIDAHCPENPAIVAPRHAEHRWGHPVLFPWAMSRDVCQLAADESIRCLLGRHPVLAIDAADDDAVRDVDTMSDYRSQLRRFGLDEPPASSE